MRKLRSAVIGVGFIGIAHIEALRRLGFVDIVAISDPNDSEKKAQELNIDKSFTDYKEMINQMNLDVVHICTPNNTHFEIAAYAIKKKIHVILEKPMTLSIEEAKILLSLAEEYQVINAVNFHNRFYPTSLYMKESIQKNAIGDIMSVSGMYLQDWLLYPTDYSWRLLKKISGNTRAIADIGSHWIDLVEFITGSHVNAVMADFKTVYHKRKKTKIEHKSFQVTDLNQEFEEIDIDTEDISTLLFRFDNGAIGNAIITQMFAGEKNKISLFISGKKASLQWDLNRHGDVIIGNRNEPNQVVTKDSVLMGNSVESIIDYPSGHSEGFPDAFKQTFKKIYRQILGFDEEILYATFKDGLHQMILDEAIYESANQNAWVNVGE
ncbi:MAG: Gfo/Idh/MocA family oxidoreductase [Acholeplasmataceae bacterium]|nr:Gfo/Idh/MocA family oxidoreductase [Acholeplasmataceae bacterium]